MNEKHSHRFRVWTKNPRMDLDLLPYTGQGNNSHIPKKGYTKHHKAREQKIAQKGSQTLLKY